MYSEVAHSPFDTITTVLRRLLPAASNHRGPAADSEQMPPLRSPLPKASTTLVSKIREYASGSSLTRGTSSDTAVASTAGSLELYGPRSVSIGSFTSAESAAYAEQTLEGEVPSNQMRFPVRIFSL